jgi:hypothetical protein
VEFDPLVKDLVLIAREKMLGERAIKNLASSIKVNFKQKINLPSLLVKKFEIENLNILLKYHHATGSPLFSVDWNVVYNSEEKIDLI